MRPETGLKMGKILAHIFCILLICVIILDSLIVLYAGFSCGSKAMLAGGTAYILSGGLVIRRYLIVSTSMPVKLYALCPQPRIGRQIIKLIGLMVLSYVGGGWMNTINSEDNLSTQLAILTVYLLVLIIHVNIMTSVLLHTRRALVAFCDRPPVNTPS